MHWLYCNDQENDLELWERESSWRKVSGTAFQNQPTLNDNSAARGREPSNHEGKYWIGGFENYTSSNQIVGATGGDSPIGTMESEAFTLYSNKISFLIGGGCLNNVGVSLIYERNIVRTSRGTCSETMYQE